MKFSQKCPLINNNFNYFWSWYYTRSFRQYVRAELSIITVAFCTLVSCFQNIFSSFKCLTSVSLVRNFVYSFVRECSFKMLRNKERMQFC